MNTIKSMREKSGLTVRELAARVGVQPMTISNAENGRIIPRADTLRKIADELDVTMDELWPSEK